MSGIHAKLLIISEQGRFNLNKRFIEDPNRNFRAEKYSNQKTPPKKQKTT